MKRMLVAVLTMFALTFALAMPGSAAAQAPSVKGEVLEVKDVESYTYLRLKTADGELWAAVNKASVKKGAQITIENPTMMNNFASKSLNRTFDKIVFGNLAGAASAAPPAKGAGTTGIASMHMSSAKPADVADVKVAKAAGPNARTVAEIFAKRSELKDKNVVVSGKVVKFTPDIMGKNWLHIRDGSGVEKDANNDLVVTTKESAKVGDVVTVAGVVKTDVDLGAGYAYKVLVEDAKLQK